MASCVRAYINGKYFSKFETSEDVEVDERSLVAIFYTRLNGLRSYFKYILLVFFRTFY